MFNEAEAVLIPYDRARYYNQSSGIVWEAVATANTLIIPADCWLEREAARLGAGYVTFESHTAEAAAQAVAVAIDSPPKSRQERIAVAKAFKKANRPERLKEQIFSHWQPK